MLESRKQSVSIPVADAEKVVSGRRVICSFYQKTLHPSRHWPGSPLNKGFLDFHPSLDPSRHLSHIPPVDGRDMGEIEKIPPVPEPLCAKAFQKI